MTENEWNIANFGDFWKKLFKKEGRKIYYDFQAEPLQSHSGTTGGTQNLPKKLRKNIAKKFAKKRKILHDLMQKLYFIHDQYDKLKILS